MKKSKNHIKNMKKVFFLADDHTYWLDREGVLSNNPIPQKAGVITQIPSVGKFYGKFFPSFESDYWLTNGALKALVPEELAAKRDGRIKPPAEEVFPELLAGVDPADFFRERHKLEEFWAFKRQNSAFLGTKFHTMMENEAKANGYIVNPWNNEVFDLIQWDKFYDNEAYPAELGDLPAGGYSELLVYDLELNVAGQIDMCFVKRIGKRKLAWVGDFKTNEKKPDRSGMESGLGPLSHLQDCKHNRYAVQLSMYAYILEKAGFEVQEIGYSFYKNYDKNAVEHIETPFLREECKNIFNY